MHQVKFYHDKIKHLSRTTRFCKQIESALPRLAFGLPYLHQHNPSVTFSIRFINLTHETNQWGPHPQQKNPPNIISELALSIFGAPVSVFCTIQIPLFHSFGKCTKNTNGEQHPPLIHPFFLPWKQSLVTLGQSVTPFTDKTP